jgi:NHLM bacteriocin system ABC transporter ATP-binding protein
MNIVNQTDLPGQIYQVKANTPILLNDPQSFWVVQSGSIAIFAVKVDKGVVKDTRRYLYICDAQEAMFGNVAHSGNSDGISYQLLAIPIGKTELRKINTTDFQELFAHSKSQVLDWIEIWLKKLDQALTQITSPKIKVQANILGRFSLTNSQTFQTNAGSLAWLKLQSGYLRWRGFPEILLTPATAIVPLNNNTWLEADGVVQLELKSSGTISNLDDLILGVSQLHQYYLYCFHLQQGQDQAEKPERLNLPGQTYQVKANEPILLNDPQSFWVVQSGSIAIFAVTVNQGVIEGARRYLCSCDLQEAMFSSVTHNSKSSGTSYQLLAVPIGKTELRKINVADLQELFPRYQSQVLDWIEIWLKKLDQALTQVTSPKIQIKANILGRFSLTDGQTFQTNAGSLAWLKLQSGYLRWRGFPEILLTPATAIVPLNNNTWLEADGVVQLELKSSDTISNLDDLILGVSQLHQYYLYCYHLQEKQEKAEELERLKAQKLLNFQATSEAFGELAAPLMPQQDCLFLEGAPLLVAAGAVGKALGVTICPPAKSEDLARIKEPLEAIARASRLRMRQVLLENAWWQQDCGALVAYTKLDHLPVALLPTADNHYLLFDPVGKTKIAVDERVAAAISSGAYMFYRSLPDKPLQVFDITRFALFGRQKDLLLIVAMGIATTLLGMLTPFTTSILIDHAIPDSDRGLLWQIGLGLIIAAIATALFRLTQGLSLLRVETASDSSTQAAVWDRLLNLPISFFRQYTTGDLQSRVNSVTSIRRQLGGNTLINLITGCFALLNLALLFYYSIKLALVALAVALLIVVVTTISGSILVRKVHPLLEVEGNIFGHVVQLINGIAKLHVAGAEERAFASWSKSYRQQIKLELSTQYIEDAVTLFNTVMPTITSGILYWFTIKMLTDPEASAASTLTVGSFLAFNTAFSTFIKGATDVSNTVTDTLQVLPQWKRARPITQAVSEVDLTKADPGKLMGRITLDRISFRYQADGALILNDVTIKAEPGEFIALVGSSGSGKSTLLRLILGFESPNEGKVYFDGQDLSGLNINAVRRQLGVVLQNGKIMSGSIFDNLSGGAQITLDEAWSAAKMSGFAEDISAMPMGMHTVISEGGGNLSGGQRQRLIIAKALILKPNILLFDEATSALDNRTQAIVSENLNRLKVTRFVIAHRLSTIQNADRIYVLSGGSVVQQGNFEELSNCEGLFADLIRRQLVGN